MLKGIFGRALVAGAGFALAGAALAAGQPKHAELQPPPKQVESTPWNYQIVNGQRVPKANRVTNADGSWREETHQGKCTTVKQKTASGEYSESRSCG